MKTYPFSQIQDLLNAANSVLIALPKDVNLDQVAGGLALFLSLQKASRQTTIVCPEAMRVEFSRLVGVDKISEKPAGSDLAVTFNYPIDGIEKVTSNDEGGKLNLVVKLKAGQPPIDPTQISFSPVGANADLIFTLGLRKLDGLGKIYFENKELFDKKPVIDIDNNSANSAFGRVNLIDQESSSISEIVSFIISGAQLPIDADIATNLILGLESATQNFQSSTAMADTFEAAALALKSGGRRGGVSIASPKTEEERGVAVEPPVKEPETPSSDWLEPKIYKGSTLP